MVWPLVAIVNKCGDIACTLCKVISSVDRSSTFQRILEVFHRTAIIDLGHIEKLCMLCASLNFNTIYRRQHDSSLFQHTGITPGWTGLKLLP